MSVYFILLLLLYTYMYVYFVVCMSVLKDYNVFYKPMCWKIGIPRYKGYIPRVPILLNIFYLSG